MEIHPLTSRYLPLFTDRGQILSSTRSQNKQILYRQVPGCLGVLDLSPQAAELFDACTPGMVFCQVAVFPRESSGTVSSFQP